MAKVRITKTDDPMKPPYEEIVKRNKEGASKWKDIYNAAIKKLKTKYSNAPEQFKNHDEYQKWMLKDPRYRQDIFERTKSGDLPITNKGRAYLKKKGVKNADKIGSWEQVPKEYQTDDFLTDQYNDGIGGQGVWAHRSANIDEEDPTPITFEEENQTPPMGEFPGNEVGYKGKGSKKNPYNKRNLPFFQAAPELAGFVSALNTYNYYTPDFTHQEINPATLNIQPQLQSIDSSLNAVNQTTTGNPSLDNARKSAAFVQGLGAKQQAFGNKQNYDANARVVADQFNINARNQEQNLDVEATSRVHNDYRALAKDYAAGERIRAMSSLANKEAKNRQNEAEKALMLDNFYQNVEFTDDGQMKVTGNPLDMYDNPYGNYKYDGKSAPEPGDDRFIGPPRNPNPPPAKYGDPSFVGPPDKSPTPVPPKQQNSTEYDEDVAWRSEEFMQRQKTSHSDVPWVQNQQPPYSFDANPGMFGEEVFDFNRSIFRNNSVYYKQNPEKAPDYVEPPIFNPRKKPLRPFGMDKPEAPSYFEYGGKITPLKGNKYRLPL